MKIMAIFRPSEPFPVALVTRAGVARDDLSLVPRRRDQPPLAVAGQLQHLLVELQEIAQIRNLAWLAIVRQRQIRIV